jgi:sugar transferase EpsL
LRMPDRYRAKRALDLGIALPAIVLFTPIMAAVAVAIRLRMGTPVLFRQVRPGLDGRPFTLYKFRTMRHARYADEPDAARLTPLGRWLRCRSLDELPELWNVVRGEMSLVGPRPLLMEYLDRYTAEQARRHEVLPGVTGWAQINGRNETDWPARFAMDVWYVDNRSFGLDLRILLRTVGLVLRGSGISEPGEATKRRFGGSRIGKDDLGS